MPTRTLGCDGLTVSRLCLGAMMFGDRTDEGEARDFADEYAAYVEDRRYEIRNPDLPIPSPSEYIR